MTNTTPERVNILNEAADLITGQRQEDYGTPQENFTRVADLWNVVIKRNLETNTPLSPRQVSDMMILLKVARTVNTPTHDSYVDISGYAGISGELAQVGRANNEASHTTGGSIAFAKQIDEAYKHSIETIKANHPSNGNGVG